MRDGVSAARVRMPPGGHWVGVLDFLADRTGLSAETVLARAAIGEVVLADGTAVGEDTAYRGGGVVYLHREVKPEPLVPFDLEVLYRDNNIIVVDKPHFLATMPRGSHVAQTVVTRLRRDLKLLDVAPAHRLDRLTAGVLLLTLRPAVRAAYQTMFARGEVSKTYVALAPLDDSLRDPVTVRNRIIKKRGDIQARIVPGEPNASTTIHMIEAQGDVGRYRLRPHTGKTHQLRVHCADVGIPIVGDPLYPQILNVPRDDFTDPLRLVAQRLEFVDPLNRESRVFESGRSLGRG